MIEQDDLPLMNAISIDGKSDSFVHSLTHFLG